MADGPKATASPKSYDFIVEDIIRVVPYTVPNVDISKRSQVKVAFTFFRGRRLRILEGSS